MEAPLIQRSVAQPQTKTHSGNICFTIICWFFQIALWAGIAYITVYLYYLKKDGESLEEIQRISIGTLAVYVIYLILEFCSGTSRYLIHKRTNEGIKAKLGQIFKSRPEIRWSVECYHYETEYYTVRNSKGEDERRSRQVRVVTHSESTYFSYYSVRDISGLLNLNCDIAQIKRKCYIKLELKEEMNFADSISVSDYERDKEAFKASNRNRDEYMDFSEKWSLPGMTHHNLIKIGDYEPCTVNCFWYIIFTLFTLAQVYKWHVSSFCIYQNYKIRKIMSTRYNLHSGEFERKYNKFNPQLNLITLKIDYEPSYYSYCDTSRTIALPTQEELQMAEKYNSKVPKYDIYTESDGDIQRCGTVKDNPDFESYNSHLAPEINTNAPPQVINNNIVNENNNAISTKPPEEGYNSTQQAVGTGGGIYDHPSGGIYAPPQAGMYAPGSSIYGQPHGGSIYDNINNQPPNGPQE